MAIRSLPKPFPTELPRAKLYLDDIEEICELLKNPTAESDDWRVRFVADDKVCDSVQDLQELGGRTKKFSINVSSFQKERSLDLGRYSSSLYIYDYSESKDAAVKWSIYGKVLAVFQKRKLGVTGMLLNALPALACVPAYILVRSSHSRWHYWVTLPIAFVTGILIAKAATPPKGIVVLEYSHKTPTLRRFLEVHYSQIIIAIIAAILGALIKAIIDRLSK